MASHPSSDPLDDPHESYTTNFPHHLRTRGISPYAPNRATTIGATPSIPRRPPIPEDFRLLSDPQTDLIDTAIVIKNIPFGYPEEDFVTKLFPQLGLVPPYAFNYHRNRADRAFHGLAFANFNAPHEAQAAVDILNNYELSGRRLRVELKKRLPAEEEQRQRLARQSRRQLPQLSPSLGIAQTTSGTIGIQESIQAPTPLRETMRLPGDLLDSQLRPRIVFRELTSPSPKAELDMNNPETLGFYTELQLFLNNHQLGENATLQFPSTLTAAQRRTVRALADKLNLKHTTHGFGSERYITISRHTTPQETVAELSVPAVSSPDFQRSGYHPFPTTRASEDRLNLGETVRSPLPPTPRLRSVASMGNLRQPHVPTPDPSTMPALPSRPHPFDLLSQFDQLHTVDPYSRQPLGHRASQESGISSQGDRPSGRPFTFSMIHATQPARQPIGPPSQDQKRGFSERVSREGFTSGSSQIRPIGHGAKTPSHGSLSHGSSRESRGGSEQSAMELQIQQGTIPHPSDY